MWTQQRKPRKSITTTLRERELNLLPATVAVDLSGDSLPDGIRRPFVVSESDKPAVPKVTVGRPLDELELPDKRGYQP